MESHILAIGRPNWLFAAACAQLVQSRWAKGFYRDAAE